MNETALMHIQVYAEVNGKEIVNEIYDVKIPNNDMGDEEMVKYELENIASKLKGMYG